MHFSSSTTTVLAAVVTAATTASAQWAGQLFVVHVDRCPNFTNDETLLDWTTYGAPRCLETPYHQDWDWSASLNGQQYGDGAAPDEFGACPTSDCSVNCTTVPIELDEHGRLNVDCFKAFDSPYIWIGGSL